MLDQFNTCFGTITGRNHTGRDNLPKGKNNQDSHLFFNGGEYLLGVVCDGCSEGNHSEVGAWTGARNLISITNSLIQSGLSPENPWFWQSVISTLGEKLQALWTLENAGFSDNFEVFRDYLLFTITGFIVQEDKTYTYELGDGTIYVNSECIKKAGGFPGNAPPYFAYRLLPEANRPVFPNEKLVFTVNAFDTNEIETLLVGSDGCESLNFHAEKNIPGTTELIAGVAPFWAPEIFENADNVRRRLCRIQRVVKNAESRLEGGYLDDDTTLITVRKK